MIIIRISQSITPFTHTSASTYGPRVTPDFDPTKGPPLPPEVARLLLDTNAEFSTVFDADKGSLPKAADHPPVKLNFKSDWAPAHCAEPRWGPGSGPVVQSWADEVLATG